MKLVSVVISCHYIQQQNVFRFRVQTGNAELHLWKHLPEKTIEKKHAEEKKLRNNRKVSHVARTGNERGAYRETTLETQEQMGG